MGKTEQLAKAKANPRNAGSPGTGPCPRGAKRGRGRPNADDPKVTMSIRFNGDLIAELDAWAKANGDIGRSAAIRQAVARLVRGGGQEK